MPIFANRIKSIQPSATLALNSKANQMRQSGIDVINLGAGEPDFDTPEFIKQGAYLAMQQGQTKYTPVDGTPALKKAIQVKFEQDNNLKYELDQLIVSNGGKQVIFLAFMATIDPGDEVIMPSPYWVSYPSIVKLFGGIPVFIPCQEDHNFKMDAQSLEKAITSRTKWVILNSPSNPTGRLYTKQELESLAAVFRKHPKIMVMSDDIYEYLIYDGHSFCNIPMVAEDLKEQTLIVNGMSKSYSMTGWRIGFGAGPKKLIKAMTTLQSQSTSNASSISQAAALTGLLGEKSFIKDWCHSFSKRRDFVLNEIKTIPGLSCVKPEGAFYLYVNCAGVMGKKTPSGEKIENDTQLCQYLLDTCHVAAVSGEAFGLSPYFRISYATSMENLEKACARIKQALELLQK